MNHRASILNRPLKPYNPSNQENGPLEYEREQEYWRSRSQSVQQTQERLRRSFDPRPEDVERNHQEIQGVLLMQQRQKDEAEKLLAEEEARWHRPPVKPNLARPWTATTMNYTAVEEDRARKQHDAVVAEENKRLMEHRAQIARIQTDQQRTMEQKDLQNEENFWSRGAAPYGVGRLHSSRAEGERRPQVAALKTPWASHDSAEPHATRPQIAGGPSTLQQKEYPWSWNA